LSRKLEFDIVTTIKMKCQHEAIEFCGNVIDQTTRERGIVVALEDGTKVYIPSRLLGPPPERPLYPR
jgi:hypothetical protein